MLWSSLLYALFLTTAWGWLPGQQKDIFSLTGENLFNVSSIPASPPPASNLTARPPPINGSAPPPPIPPSPMANSSTSPPPPPPPVAHGSAPPPTSPPMTNISGPAPPKPNPNTRGPKIRGVNLGSYFIVEPWMVGNTWPSSPCSTTGSESDCIFYNGLSTAMTSYFLPHWDTYISEYEIQQMADYGLNTLRVPLGYWLFDELVEEGCGGGVGTEWFPSGSVLMGYLERLVGWASGRGLYIILEMHGAPMAQENNAFTGQIMAPRFYTQDNYDRAIRFFAELTRICHTNYAFRNVGMLGLLSEPIRGNNLTKTMINYYYPEAYQAIRDVEESLGVESNDRLHVQVMNEKWGSGTPRDGLAAAEFLAYSDHRYIKYDGSVTVSKDAYLADACKANRNSNDSYAPTIVDEWSISVATSVEGTDEWSTANNFDFYTKFFAAQAANYEATTLGWVFWSWKTDLGDCRWSYSEAVEAGVIPRNAADIDRTVCDGIGQPGNP